MDRIDKYKRRDFRSDKYNNNRPWRDFSGPSGAAAIQMVNMAF